MLSTFKAVVREKKVVFLEEADLPEGTEVLWLPILNSSDSATSNSGRPMDSAELSLDKIWNQS